MKVFKGRKCMGDKVKTRVIVKRIFFFPFTETYADYDTFNFLTHRIDHELMSLMKGLKSSDVESSFHLVLLLRKILCQLWDDLFFTRESCSEICEMILYLTSKYFFYNFSIFSLKHDTCVMFFDDINN